MSAHLDVLIVAAPTCQPVGGYVLRDIDPPPGGWARATPTTCTPCATVAPMTAPSRHPWRRSARPRERPRHRDPVLGNARPDHRPATLGPDAANRRE